jgi:hypothetical protein
MLTLYLNDEPPMDTLRSDCTELVRRIGLPQ